ncbi:hypothetical protein NYQ44_14825 [Xanthomonas translucens pv. undulosa]|nr:hypothetical protein [Xanthomonas translucens pv. undulosa]
MFHMQKNLSKEKMDFYRENLLPAYLSVCSSSVAKKYLSASNVCFNGFFLNGQGVKVGKKHLTDQEFCHLFMVIDGAVASDMLHLNTDRRNSPRGVYVLSEVAGVTKNNVVVGTYRRSIFDFDAKSIFMHHMMLEKSASRSLLGTVAVSLSLLTAFKLGFTSVRTKAAGGYDPLKNQIPSSEYFGYAICPKFGFDAPLARFERADPDFAGCRTVQDVRKKSPELWEEKGFARYMDFDMSLSGESWKILLGYLKSKGLLH